MWLRTGDFGDPREERVIRKADGDYTYLAGDLAYHRNKFLVRGFDRVINVWGADHHGQVASLMAGVEAMGVERDRLEVRLGQMISLTSGRMSKRAGNAVDLDDLVDEIGPDAMRLLSLLNSIDQGVTIDLDKVRAESKESPVYYVQYAHTRIASIGRVAEERGVVRRPLGAGRPRAPRARARARGAALALRAPRRRAPRVHGPRPAQGRHVGARARRPLPRLLPRLLRAG